MAKKNEQPDFTAKTDGQAQTDIDNSVDNNAVNNAGNGDGANAGAGNADDPQPAKTDGQKTAVLARHRTQYPKYRCAGLVLSQKAENFLVSGEQLERLRRDAWVELKE